MYDDRDRLAELAAAVDVVTYEFENVPVEAARFVERLRPVFPPPAALEAAQDRLAEKQLFGRSGLAGAGVRAGRLAGLARRGARTTRHRPQC